MSGKPRRLSPVPGLRRLDLAVARAEVEAIAALHLAEAERLTEAGATRSAEAMREAVAHWQSEWLSP